jgi:hypothetical protein
MVRVMGHVQVRHLSTCMYAGVCATGADNAQRLAKGAAQRMLKRFLDGTRILLELPSSVVCAIVFNQ